MRCTKREAGHRNARDAQHGITQRGGEVERVRAVAADLDGHGLLLLHVCARVHIGCGSHDLGSLFPR